MARYLIRLTNQDGLTPQETGKVAQMVRGLLGSKESIGNLRLSSSAIEFDLFANDQKDLAAKRTLLEEKVAKVLTLKRLDLPPVPRPKLEVLREGIGLFDEERFWECHEVLEQIWHPAKGTERDVIQGLILTAAALVHHQKAEDKVCLSMLRKAQDRLGTVREYEGVDLQLLRQKIQNILDSKTPGPFKMPRAKA